MKVGLIYLDALVTPHPIGLLYIATYLWRNGVKVYLIGIDPSNKNAERDFVSELEKINPQVVGISLLTRDVERMEKVAEITKQTLGKCFIVCGGVHPTVLSETVLKNRNIDCIVIGEGEETMLALIKCIKDKKDISNVNGIAFLDKRCEIQFTPPRPYICNLDVLPFPNRDLLPNVNALSTLKTGYLPLPAPQLDIMVARGCPYNCAFCQPSARNMFGMRVRSRSPENVIAELKFLKRRYKIIGAEIESDTFTANKNWVYRFCQLIIDEKVNLRWYVNAHIKAVDKELLKLMKKAGCEVITLAIESGSDRIRNEILKKNVNREQIFSAFEIANQSKILTQANIMVGNPTETEEDLRESINIIDLLQPDFLNSSYTSILPGTYLWEKYSKDMKFNKWAELDIDVPKSFFHNIPIEKLAVARAYLESNYALYGKKSFKKFIFKKTFTEIILYRWKCYLQIRPRGVGGDIRKFIKEGMRTKQSLIQEFLKERKHFALQRYL